ncbi:fimbria/pilus outer membrane usher protein [Rhodanobacter sp. BL-MT-08]
MREHKLKLIALSLLCSPGVMAQSSKMLLDFCVNGSCYGTAFVLVRHSHILVEDDALKRASIPLEGVAEERIGAKQFVDITAYAAKGSVELDDKAGRLSVNLPANAFAANSLNLNPRAAVLKPTAVPSLFVNYALNAGSQDGSASAYLDGGVAYGQWLLRDTPSWSQSQGFSRGLTRLEYDDSSHLRRLTIGDQYVFSSDGLGGTALLGGIGLVRAFDLDPYLITFPQPTISGLLQAPGTVDIYKNGVLVGQRQIAAGPFNLSGLGLGPGANNVSVVIHDPFGGTRTLQQSFYGATQLLSQGLSDYAFQAGIERTSTLANGYEAGRGVLLLRQNYGFTNALTAGYRMEAENGLVNAGTSASVRLPIGYLSGGIAASRNHGEQGQGSSLGYQYSNQRVSLGVGVQTYSSDYSRIGDDLLPASVRPRRVSYANASWSPFGRFSLQASAGDIVYASGARQRNVGINGTFNLPGDVSLLLGVNRQLNRPGDNDKQLTANLVIPLGNGSIGFNGTHDANSGSSYGFSAQRSVPTDTGWGYSVNAQQGSSGASDLAQLDYQGRDGLVQFTGQRFGGQTSGNILVSGSVIAMDDHVYAGRVLQNGYALVETPGVADVGITRENQPVGKTDANGTLLVTNLLPYQANKVGIDQNSVPLQYQIDSTQQMMSVPRLGGTIVRFGVHTLHAARGTLTLDGKPVQYGNATLQAGNKSLKTLIGLDGSFYFPDLPAGNYQLRANTGSGDMRCMLHMPASKKPMTNLGKLSCTSADGATP